MVVYFNVIVDVYPGLIPFGILVRSRRHWQGIGVVYRLKQLLARFLQPPHRAIIETLQALPDGRIELRQTVEGTLS